MDFFLTKWWFFLLLAWCLLSGCGHKKFKKVISGHYRLSYAGTMEKAIDESSGMVPAGDSLYWTHNDGNKPWLFKIDKRGKTAYKVKMPGNFIDIEDVAADGNGFLYIGDFGNNTNKRTCLFIYKYSPLKNAFTDTLRFRYADQHEFPPSTDNMNFDCEGFFFHNDSLYLFSKNRGLKLAKLYVLPARGGQYLVKKSDEVLLQSLITGAAINPSATRYALITYGYLYIFNIKNGRISFSHLSDIVTIPNGGQMEAVCFTNDHDLLITNEQGHIFEVKRHTP